MTLSSPSFLAASTSASMPPKSSADVASQAFTPDSVCSPSFFFSGGAHADESGDEDGGGGDAEEA